MLKLKKKDPGIAPVVVVAILMLCALAVAYLAWSLSLNVSGETVDGTYEAYEILTGDEIEDPYHVPEGAYPGGSITGGTGGIYDYNDKGNDTLEKPGEKGVYRVYVRVFDDTMGYYYPFENGDVRQCYTFYSEPDWRTYADFLSDTDAHDNFEYNASNNTLSVDGRAHGEIYEVYDIFMDGSGNEESVSASDAIDWYTNGDNYYTEILIIADIKLESNEKVYIIDVEGVVDSDILSYYESSDYCVQYLLITNKEYETYEEIKQAVGLQLSNNYAVYTHPSMGKFTVTMVGFYESEGYYILDDPLFFEEWHYTPMISEYEEDGKIIRYCEIYLELAPDEYYRASDGTIYIDSMPDAPQTGDIYYSGDYQYFYNGYLGCYYEMYIGTDNSMNGWGCKALDNTKSEYGEILPEICGKPVKNMDYCFYNCSNMTSAPAIPDTVESMCYTFLNCSNLTSINNLPARLKETQSTFASCVSLKSVPDLPDGITELPGTFEYCESLVAAPKLPSGLTLMISTFNGCKSLTAVAIPNGVTHLISTFKNCVSLSTMPTIPNSVVDMREAFMGCSGLTVTSHIPEGVQIMEDTFQNCTKLKTVTNIPSTVTLLDATFLGCTSLVNVPSLKNLNVTGLPNVFVNTGLVTAPELPATVNTLYRTFSSCKALKNVEIPYGVTELYSTFTYCTAMTETPIIPSSVVDLLYTFEYCTSLTDVPQLPENLTSLFSAFRGCTSLKNVPTLPSSTITIWRAFADCSSLETAPAIPRKCKVLEEAFKNCTSLTGEIEINSINLSSGKDCFYGTVKPIRIMGSTPFAYTLQSTANNGNVTVR